MEMSLHHVQLSGPPGCEDDARAFWVGFLGLVEVPKPEALRARGGAWFRAEGCLEVHVGIEADFRPAAKAHPGIAVVDVEALSRAVADAGRPVTWDENVPELRRFHTTDPMGNRLEFQQRSAPGGGA
ncbi:glyoxalase [Terracoccus luteus]|uniref:Catechol 2,3-dioxygenase-like lactoylglutathione lyase family enzyme n=1 Tax=Terracoccus luteus TaxID=53356 RepID=A0A839PRR0_9MICO|nr:glyoxalase [Terracoccus luteus]MBB2985759.1 catechol 2,3-dioxygenase-like lactoylglutathione lyase family enzyme [Terracoccus luteus]MCP2171411.1 catechol 2,3-dioxygenase-like lactoylglutathione lyase family enzyme [Terracoccus luteus]